MEPHLALRTLTLADRDAIRDVLLHDCGYATRVHGRPTQDGDVDEILTARPPATTQDQKHTLGLYLDGQLVGIADLVVDHPQPGTNYLGLLQVDARHQGRGLARQFHERLLQAFPDANQWRLTVVDTNAEVIGFWQRMGYGTTGQQHVWTSPSGAEHTAIVMQRQAAADPR